MSSPVPLSFLAAGAIALGAILASAGCSSPPAASHGRVVVNYVHPENFTDVQSSYTDGTAQGYLDDLRRYLENEAGPYIPVDQTLTMTFTDIDMAGAVGMQARASAVRVVRNSTPLRIKFSYAITDAGGKVVKEGKEDLVNMFPATQVGFNRGDPLYHEKEELSGWIRKTLR